MNVKRIFFSALATCTVIGLIHRLLTWACTKPTLEKPTSNGMPYEAIDAYIEEQMKRLKIPGVSLAIVKGDQIVHLRGFGRARPGGGAPTPQTPFVLGSTTKSITALAVMQLVEAGEVELDAPVQRYLPWFRVSDLQASARITVRHLLNQTSGLPILAGMINLADLDDDPEATERQARGFSTLKLSHPAGAAFEYSNLNYNLLGLIIEAASSERYEDYIQRHIFAPLEMNHSHTSLAAAKQDGLAAGHRYWFGHPVANIGLPLPRGSLPSGQLISSAEDMAHYLMAHLNGGRYRGTQILSSEGIEALHREAAEQWVMGRPVAGYGMGWFITKIDQTKVISHGGNVPDFSSYMVILPEQKKGLVFLANADHWGLPFVLMEVGDGAAALLARQEPPPIRLGFLPWVMRASALIPLLQVAGVLATLRMLAGWRREPASRPSGGSAWGEHVLLPLIPNLSLAAMLVYLRSSGLLRYMQLYMPDLSWIARISGSLAGIWAVLRSGLILRTLRKPRG